MIRFERVSAPQGFHERVWKRGNEWLRDTASGRPPAYWTEFLAELADAFQSLCAYSAMYVEDGTVDHFISICEDRSKAYDWTNYRYAAGSVNSRKRSVHSSMLIDPFDVQEEWFEVLLPSLELVVTDKMPVELRARAQFMLERLQLGRGGRVMRRRAEWMRMYVEGELTLDGLAKKAPLLAAAIRKQQGTGELAGNARG